MDSIISSFCKSLAAFCNHVESSSQELSESVQRKPIPLDSAASAFFRSLDRRISATASDLNLLQSIAFDTVSFEELLGYCNEVYKVNHKYISELKDRLRSFGCVPEIEMDDEENHELDEHSSFSCTSTKTDKSLKRPVVDELFDDAPSLKSLGLSDVSVAPLAFEGSGSAASSNLSSQKLMSQNLLANGSTVDAVNSAAKVSKIRKAVIEVSENDYDQLPAFMKGLSSWEELQLAIEKINSYLCGNDGANASDALDNDVLEMLDLGRKARSYLLLLLRLNQLSAETIGGSILYRVRNNY
uniref:Uncharacterized protein n=1 Tax=Apostasia odorata TaxID=280455 RepID=A0A1S6YFV2_9ASPA|nr:hypothetical protein [Apostasia odorata]